LETRAAGLLKIPAAVVRGIRMGGETDVLLETDFLKGEAGPWKTRSRPGTWTLGEGGLISHHGRGDNEGEGPPFYAPLDQKGAITIVARVKVVEGQSLYLGLVVFSDSSVPQDAPGDGDAPGSLGTAFVGALFVEDEINLICMRKGGGPGVQQIQRELGREIKGGLLRLAYDPEAAKVRIWIDGDEVETFTFQKPVPTEGKFVMIDADSSVRVESVRVLRGIVPPGADETALARGVTDGKCLVIFANSDRVSATRIRTVDGQLEMATDHGDIRCAPALVSRIFFSAKAPPARPPAPAGYALVETGACRLHLRLDRLTADELVGQSDYLGEVKLRRGAVGRIDFNPPAPVAEKSATPGRRSRQLRDPS
jgi:hypothetical protein